MELRDIIQTGSLVGFLLICVVFGGYKGWWYFGPQVDRQLDERDKQIGALKQSADEWKAIAMTQLQANKQAADNQTQIAGIVREVIKGKDG